MGVVNDDDNDIHSEKSDNWFESGTDMNVSARYA